jgi:hypothetical protein
VIVASNGTKTVKIFDNPSAPFDPLHPVNTGISGKTFNQSLDYRLVLGSSNITSSEVLWDNIGADGQVGSGRSTDPKAIGETVTVTINGTSTQISGPGGKRSDSDWDGSSGWPMNQLWDDTGYNVGPVSDTGIKVTHTSKGDCVTPIANVVAY